MFRCTAFKGFPVLKCSRRPLPAGELDGKTWSTLPVVAGWGRTLGRRDEGFPTGGLCSRGTATPVETMKNKNLLL